MTVSHKVGSMMGSGGMIVMDEGTCMVDVAKYFVHFLQEESCGKCLPCREGLKRMGEILDGITEGKGDGKACSFSRNWPKWWWIPPFVGWGRQLRIRSSPL